MSTDIDFTKWIGDSSDGGIITQSEGAITIASAKAGTPFNARIDGKVPAGDLYYEVTVVDLPQGSSLGVGLVTQDNFQPGWKTKGCFYNGNISNGSAGLIIGFGPYTKSGDSVGVYLRRLENKFEVAFYHNKRCLGAGFAIDGSSMMYPCLHVSGSAAVKVTPGTIPTVFSREAASSEDAYSGKREIKKLYVGPELGEYPLPQGSFVVTLEKGDGAQYSMGVKIGNMLSTTLELTGKMEAYDAIKITGGCVSTRMMPPPELQELEGLVRKELSGDNESSGLKKMIANEDGSLIISGPTMEMSCVRLVETFEPVKSI